METRAETKEEVLAALGLWSNDREVRERRAKLLLLMGRLVAEYCEDPGLLNAPLPPG